MTGVQTCALPISAKTPAAIVSRLQQEIARAVQKPEVKELLFNAGVESNGNSTEDFAAFVKNDITRMGKVIKDAGIRE